METKALFKIIDEGIAIFNADKRLNISNDTHSDWLIFDTRKISWQREGLKFFIQIFPNFNPKEEITSWTLYSVAWYDKQNERYLKSKVFADKVQLNEIVTNIIPLLNDAYTYINSFRKFDIPKVPDINK